MSKNKVDNNKKFKDETGNRYGRLVVLCYDHRHHFPNGRSTIMWQCLCDCGNNIIVNGWNLRQGQTKSCGCWQKERAAILCKSRVGTNHPGHKYIGENNPMYGRIGPLHPMYGRVGSLHPVYNHNLSSKDRLIREKHRNHDGQFTMWSLAIKKRDNYICQYCDSKEKLESHHIFGWTKFPGLRYNLCNGICLCKKCHREHHKLNGRK